METRQNENKSRSSAGQCENRTGRIARSRVIGMLGLLVLGCVLGWFLHALFPLPSSSSVSGEKVRTRPAASYHNQTVGLSFESFVSGAELIRSTSNHTALLNAYRNETRTLSFGQPKAFPSSGN